MKQGNDPFSRPVDEIPQVMEVEFIGFEDDGGSSSDPAGAGGTVPLELLAAAEAARDRRDWGAALAAWQAVRNASPDEATAAIGAAQALRELGRLEEAALLLRAAAGRFPAHAGIQHDLGRVAERLGDWAEAEACWQRFVALDPGPWWGYANLAHALNRLERAAEADAVMAAAQQRQPGEFGLFLEYARLAERRGDWQEALARWQAANARFPEQSVTQVGAATALRELGRTEEAEALLRAAAEQAPDQALLQHDLARLAEARADWTQAEHRWRRFLALDTDQWWAHTGLANALRQQGRIAEAETVLLAAQARLPGEIAVFADYAELAETEERWSQAAERWEVVRTRWPSILRGYLGMGLALARATRFDDADDVLEDAMRRFPSAHDAVAVFAEIAVLRHDWRQAVLRWTHARMLFPQLEGFGHRLFEARLRLLEADPTDDKAQQDVLPTMSYDRRRLYDVMMSFESLGNGCEFGTVQRIYGAEPLDLLRWAAIAPLSLVAALNSNFAGIGTVDQTELFIHQKEYILRDTVFDTGMHTFITEDKISYEKMLEQSCKRLKFLSQKLLNDIKDAEKIFIYFQAHIEPAAVSALFAALRRHGEATLFVVQVADDIHPAGTIDILAPGLMMGYVASAGFVPGGGAHKIPIEAWGEICCAALKLARPGEGA